MDGHITQYVIKSDDKADIIKTFNKHRRASKNEWYQVEVQYGIFTYQFKCWETWCQIARKTFTDTGERIHNNPNCGDQSVKQFTDYLHTFINN
jgi:hypothetical protein